MPEINELLQRAAHQPSTSPNVDLLWRRGRQRRRRRRTINAVIAAVCLLAAAGTTVFISKEHDRQTLDVIAPPASTSNPSSTTIGLPASHALRTLTVTADGETWRLAEEPLTEPSGHVRETGWFNTYDPKGATAGGGGLSSPLDRMIGDVLYKGKYYLTARGAVPDNVSRVEIVATSGATLKATVQDGIFFAVTSDPAFATNSPGCNAGPSPTATCQQSNKIAALRYLTESGTLVCALDTQVFKAPTC
jgi:hypothetical protein